MLLLVLLQQQVVLCRARHVRPERLRVRSLLLLLQVVQVKIELMRCGLLFDADWRLQKLMLLIARARVRKLPVLLLLLAATVAYERFD